jgi:heme A synthase
VLFMLSEALIGAGLVLFGLVADDRSPARAVVLGVHLTNTFFLLAAMALCARFAVHPVIPPPPWRRSAAGWWAAALLGGVLATGVTGAMVALGDTLFPATSLAHGIAQDRAPDAHALVRLRVWHPVVAVLVSIALARFARAQRQRFPWAIGTLAQVLVAVVTLQLLAGAVNVVLLAPVWLQLVHLLLADVLWVTLVVLVAALLDAEALPGTERYGASVAPTMAAPIGTRSLP